MVGITQKAEVKYEDVGFCSYCLMTIQAIPPDGTDVRHKSTLTPYGECPQYLKAHESK